MWRVLSGIVVGLLVLGGVLAYTNNVFGASPPAQTKPESPGQAPQKAGGQTRPAGQAGQGGGRVVTAAPVKEGDVRLNFTYTGTVQARSQVNLAPRTSGRVEKILVDVGGEVKEGDPIAVLERGTLQLAVQQAEANLKSAQARLNTVMSGGRAEDITSAEAALASARARYNITRNGATPADLQAAQSAVDSARANLASAEARQETVKAGPTLSDLASAQSALDSARANLKTAEVRLNQVKSGATAAELQAAQAAVADAKGKLLAAQDTYETARDNFSAVASKVSSVSAASQAVQSAQASYDEKVQKLNQLLTGPQAVDLQSAQSSFDSSTATYEAALARLEQLKRSPTPQDLQQAQSSADSARATLISAETRLAQLQNGPTEDDLTVAGASVIQAEQTLALRRQPYTAQDLVSAQAAVDVATVALTAAKTNLADATLTAPFDGIVTARLLSPGAMASTQSAVVTLVGSDLDITVAVEEARLTRLKPGLGVSLSAPTYPGETFQGKVASIAPSADARSHTFAMKVVPDGHGGKLKPGMFAELKVTAEQRTGTLVPRDAVVVRSGKDVLFVVADGRAQMREVVVGLPQGDELEILSGVKAGEQVIVVGHGGLNDGDAVRTTGSGDSAQPAQPQQNQPGAPGKTPSDQSQQRPSAPAKGQQ